MAGDYDHGMVSRRHLAVLMLILNIGMKFSILI